MEYQGKRSYCEMIEGSLLRGIIDDQGNKIPLSEDKGSPDLLERLAEVWRNHFEMP